MSKAEFIREIKVASCQLLEAMDMAKDVERGSAQGGETIGKLLRATVCRVVVKQKIVY